MNKFVEYDLIFWNNPKSSHIETGVIIGGCINGFYLINVFGRSISDNYKQTVQEKHLSFV